MEQTKPSSFAINQNEMERNRAVKWKIAIEKGLVMKATSQSSYTGGRAVTAIHIPQSIERPIYMHI